MEEGERDLAHDLPLPLGDDDQATRLRRRKRNLLRDALEVAASSALAHPNLLQVGGEGRVCVCGWGGALEPAAGGGGGAGPHTRAMHAWAPALLDACVRMTCAVCACGLHGGQAGSGASACSYLPAYLPV